MQNWQTIWSQRVVTQLFDALRLQIQIVLIFTVNLMYPENLYLRTSFSFHFTQKPFEMKCCHKREYVWITISIFCFDLLFCLTAILLHKLKYGFDTFICNPIRAQKKISIVICTFIYMYLPRFVCSTASH